MLDKYKSAMGDADTTTQQASGAFGEFGDVVTGALAAISVQKIAEIASQMQQLGDAVNISRAQFGALTSDIGGANTVLQGLQQATGGVVDNITLMNASSQLLKTGLVSTGSELNQFLGDVERLKPAGEDLNSAIGQLSQAMQSQTTRGLNQFGVNVDEVKAKYEELKAAGEDAAQAFKDAVFAGMSTEITKLGDAADAAITPLQKLQTQIENIKQDLASNFASGVEGVVNFGEASVQYGQTQAAFQAQVNRVLANLPKLVISGQSGGVGSVDPDAYAAENGSNIDHSSAQIATAQQIVQWTNQITDAWGKAATSVFTYFDHVQQVQQQASAAATARQPLSDYIRGFNENFAAMTQIAMGDAPNGMFRLTPDNTSNLPKYMTQGTADQLKQFSDQLKQAADDAKTQFGDLITDDDKQNMSDLVTAAQKLADAGQKAADAFKNMKLTDVFGQSSGGLAGQGEDQFIQYLQSKGMSAQQITQYQNAMDMSNGRQTNSSQTFQSQFLPMLAGLSPADAAKAMQNLMAQYQQIALKGLSFDQFNAAMPQLAGVYGGGSRPITIKPGEGTSQVLADNPGLTMAQLMGSPAAMANGRGVLAGTFNVGTSSVGNPMDFNSYLQQMSMQGPGGAGAAPGAHAVDLTQFTAQSQQAATSFTSMSTSTQAISTAVKDAGALLGSIFSKQYTLKLDLDAPDWVKLLLQAGGIDLTKSMTTTVKNNGGNVPGQQTPGRSSRVIDR